MDYTSNLDVFSATAEIVAVDLLLSGDNALVIAMACRSLGEKQARRAMRIGIAAAILVRLFFTFIITTLLTTPGLKIVGAVALILIAIELIAGEAAADAEGGDEQAGPERLTAAITMIVVADLTMGIDNIVALAAIARGNFLYLAFGLALSIPLLMVGSVLISRLLSAWPILVVLGGALLGWIAGGLIASDPSIADWLGGQAPALAMALPWMVAAFVVLQAWLVRDHRQKGAAHGAG